MAQLPNSYSYRNDILLYTVTGQSRIHGVVSECDVKLRKQGDMTSKDKEPNLWDIGDKASPHRLAVVVLLAGTKNQLKATTTRKPAAMPKDAGEPIACKIARLQKPPTKSAAMPSIL